MEHGEAISSQAVERYLLGQMPESEAEAFEQHFFVCAVCTEELRSGAMLTESLRTVSAREVLPQTVPRSSRWNWFQELWRRPVFAVPSFAAVLLACVVGYQAVQLARANKPQVLVSAILQPAARGGENRIVVPPGRTHFLIPDLEVPNASFPNYRIDLCDHAGRVVFAMPSAAPPSGSSLNLLIPVRGLRPGAYTLRVHGVASPAVQPEIGYYRFLLQLP